MQRLFFTTMLLFSVQTYAADTLNFNIHQQYVTPRSLGMGGTFMGIDDYNTPFYNPAMLPRLKEGELNFGIQAASSFETLEFVGDIGDASQTGTQSQNIDAINAVLNENYGTPLGFRFPHLQAIWTRPGWGMAILPVDLSVTLIPNDKGLPALDVTAYQDTTIAYGQGWNVGKYFSWGYTGKLIYRGNVNRAVLSSELAVGGEIVQESDFREGLTLDADVGVLYTPPIAEKGMWSWFKFAKPSFGMVVRNIGDYGYFESFNLISEQSGSPEKLGRRIDIGSKWELPSFWVFKPQVLIEQRDILHDYYSFIKGLHLGAELAWKVAGWLQGSYQLGLSQGYITAGIGAQLTWFRLDLATYSEEIGTADATKENRQYMVKLNLNF